MENKLQELTQKLYNEGVEKAKIEADALISDAKQQAADILNQAKAEAATIEAKAKKDSEELRKNIESEIKLSTKQVIATVKNQITNLIIKDLLASDLKENLNNSDFLSRLIETIVKKWNPAESEDIKLEIILPETEKENFDKYIKAKINTLLQAGLNVTFEDNFTSGFKIAPSDNSFIINFTQEDFDSFFKSYLRPKTSNLLYGDE